MTAAWNDDDLIVLVSKLLTATGDQPERYRLWNQAMNAQPKKHAAAYAVHMLTAVLHAYDTLAESTPGGPTLTRQIQANADRIEIDRMTEGEKP